MKILVLGGTGAMGEYLVEILASCENEVYVTSRSYHESRERIHYIQGDAHNQIFLLELFKFSYDAIVDFMIYGEEEFQQRFEILLKNTKQYIFISSGRVYAEAKSPITEESLRLLDVCKDNEYLATNEYALLKARQENLLFSSEYKNWTIIRPYITYSSKRLQLGAYEKEQWLYRALKGRTIVLSRDIASCVADMTYGVDVSTYMAKMIGNKKALGEVVQIAAPYALSWQEVLKLYLDVLERTTRNRPKVFMVDTYENIAKVLGNNYQVKYDRLYNRVFNSQKANVICEEKLEYTTMEKGLEKCLLKFLEDDSDFKDISWKFEAYMDKLVGENTKLTEIPTWKQKIKYIICRYTPYFYIKGIR